MFLHSLMSWVLLIVIGFNSMVAAPAHALHLENDNDAVINAMQFGTSEADAHRDLEEVERCAYCDAFAQLAMACIPRSLEKTAPDNLAFKVIILHAAPSLGIWHDHSSGLDPPAFI